MTNRASLIARSGVASVSSSSSTAAVALGGFVEGLSLCKILRVSWRKEWVLKIDLRFGLVVVG